MADVYVAKKVAAVLPPPAFSDIAKPSNDVGPRLLTVSLTTVPLLTAIAAAHQ